MEKGKISVKQKTQIVEGKENSNFFTQLKPDRLGAAKTCEDEILLSPGQCWVAEIRQGHFPASSKEHISSKCVK